MTSPTTAHPRSAIYYWKCDRPAAFHGTDERSSDAEISGPLLEALRAQFPGKTVVLQPAGGQGNHRTYFADLDGVRTFVRVEDGPEGDDYIEVETRVLREVRSLGIPAPEVLAVDASRRRVPFAWQVMELIPAPDLNQHHKQGRLDLPKIAHDLGAAVAHWQTFTPPGFGPFNPETLRQQDRLVGFHASYADYFHLHLERHLRFLADSGFLSTEETHALADEIASHGELLALDHGCLAHKDLALWNVLGTANEITAFIDWDDSIVGDPLDDLSLLGCFFDSPFLAQTIAGYESVRPLPEEAARRFWLHLLRNMIVKAVIRVGAGYFTRTDGFYLIGAGGSGSDLKTFTLARLAAARRGLRENLPIASLGCV